MSTKWKRFPKKNVCLNKSTSPLARRIDQEGYRNEKGTRPEESKRGEGPGSNQKPKKGRGGIKSRKKTTQRLKKEKKRAPRYRTGGPRHLGGRLRTNPLFRLEGTCTDRRRQKLSGIPSFGDDRTARESTQGRKARREYRIGTYFLTSWPRSVSEGPGSKNSSVDKNKNKVIRRQRREITKKGSLEKTVVQYYKLGQLTRGG